MPKRITIAVVLIILVSLIISIYIPNRKKIEETENTTIIYKIIENEGKYGVTQNDEIVIKPQYDEIIIPNQHRAVFFCKINEKTKIVNDKNDEIFSKYNNVELIKIRENQYEKNIFTYKLNGTYGLLAVTGETITDAKYEEIFSSGLKEAEVIVKENGKYGILDEKGKSKIKTNFDSIRLDEYYTEEDGYKKSGYIVQQTTSEGYRYGYYDNEGIQVLAEEYNQINRLTQIKSNDIYLIAAKNGQYGVFINNNKIVNTQYQQIDYNQDLQIFITERTGKFGVITLNGTEILKPEYTEIQINGIYIYTIKDEEKKIWDNTGKEIDIPFNTVIQRANTDYYIKKEDDNYSILNSKFEQISKQQYKYLEYAFDNYFIATNDEDKYGIIDLQENTIMEFKYDSIQMIRNEEKIQAIDFSTNMVELYDTEFKLLTD